MLGKSKDESAGPKPHVIGAAVAGGVVLILLVVILIVYFRKRENKGKPWDQIRFSKQIELNSELRLKW